MSQLVENITICKDIIYFKTKESITSQSMKNEIHNLNDKINKINNSRTPFQKIYIGILGAFVPSTDETYDLEQQKNELLRNMKPFTAQELESLNLLQENIKIIETEKKLRLYKVRYLVFSFIGEKGKQMFDDVDQHNQSFQIANDQINNFITKNQGIIQ